MTDQEVKLKILKGEQAVCIEQTRIFLSAAEFRVLRHLIEEEGAVTSRKALTSLLKKTGVELGDERVADVIYRLRGKLGRPHIIRTVYGGGYAINRNAVVPVPL